MLKMSIILKQCDSQTLPFKLIKAIDVKYLSYREMGCTHRSKTN